MRNVRRMRQVVLGVCLFLAFHRPIVELGIRGCLPFFLEKTTGWRSQVGGVDWRGRHIVFREFRLDTFEFSARFDTLDVQVHLFPFSLDLVADQPQFDLLSIPTEPFELAESIHFQNGTLTYRDKQYRFDFEHRNTDRVTLFQEGAPPQVIVEREGERVSLRAEKFEPPLFEKGSFDGEITLVVRDDCIVESVGKVKLKGGTCGQWFRELDSEVEWESGEGRKNLDGWLKGEGLDGSLRYQAGMGGKGVLSLDWEGSSYLLEGRLFEASHFANWLEMTLTEEGGERIGALSVEQPIAGQGKLRCQFGGLDLTGSGHFAFSPDAFCFELDALDGVLLEPLGPFHGGKLLLEEGRLEGDWKGVTFDLEARLAEGKGEGPGQIPFHDLSGELSIQKNRIAIRNGRCQSWIPLSFDLVWKGPEVAFDIRGVGDSFDWFRFVGEGKREEIRMDENRSHMLGEPIQVHACALHAKGPTLAIEGHLPSRALNVFPLPAICPGDLDWNLTLSPDESELFAKGDNWVVKGHAGALALHLVNQGHTIEVETFTIGPVSSRFHLTAEGGMFRVEAGAAEWEGAGAVAFEGSLSHGGHFDFKLPNVRADVGDLHLFGGGHLSGDLPHWELDLDLPVLSVRVGSCVCDNQKPVHLYATPEGGLIGRSVEFRVVGGQGGASMEGEVEFLHLDPSGNKLRMEGGNYRIPLSLMSLSSSWGDLSLQGDWEWNPEGLYFSGREESFGLTDLQLEVKQERVKGTCFSDLLGRPARFAVSYGPDLQLTIDDGAERGPLTLSASINPPSIHSIQGAIRGFDAAFVEEEEGKLTGRATFDFRTLADLFPKAFKGVTSVLKLGGGYELMGTLTAPFTFEGWLKGKTCQLMGVELDSLAANVNFDLHHLIIRDLSIADRAASLKMARLDLQEGEHWQLSIPKVELQELRPSLLKTPGKERGAVGPLVVRSFNLYDLKGAADLGETYTAHGDLAFINSFRRTSSLFDVPSDILGRIFGFDLELLIPVIGSLDFELKEGRCWVTALRDAFSEGKRAEFFLVSEGLSPSIDLEGNLSLVIKMRQYVLLKITEPLLIAIDGTLGDPHFHFAKTPP